MNEVVPPTERTCERCGRRDVWDEDVLLEYRFRRWREADRRPVPFHEWDINGNYNPLAE